MSALRTSNRTFAGAGSVSQQLPVPLDEYSVPVQLVLVLISRLLSFSSSNNILIAITRNLQLRTPSFSSAKELLNLLYLFSEC